MSQLLLTEAYFNYRPRTFNPR